VRDFDGQVVEVGSIYEFSVERDFWV